MVSKTSNYSGDHDIQTSKILKKYAYKSQVLAKWKFQSGTNVHGGSLLIHSSQLAIPKGACASELRKPKFVPLLDIVSVLGTVHLLRNTNLGSR